MEEMDNSFRTTINGDEHHRQATKRRALQDEYSLDKLLKVGRSLEISESQARHLEGRNQTINSVFGRNRSYQPRRNYSLREDKPPTHFNKNVHNYKQKSLIKPVEIAVDIFPINKLVQ